jgi:hypothetical protein
MNYLDVVSELAKSLEGKPKEEQDVVLAELRKNEQFVSFAKSALDEDTKNRLAAKARVDSPEGYSAFYELTHGFTPPPHIMREIEVIYKAHAEGVGSVVFAWRGSWKSVSISVTFIAYRIGLEPDKTNMVVSANDDSSEKVTKAVAAIIEYHPEWKRVFPNVVPDTGKWSVEGFSVLDTAISREEWAKRQSGVIDPTLVGGGYKSSRLIGKHPSGVLCIDDIHDRDNSSSERERRAVVDILVKTILKTVIKEKDKMTTWLVAVGTPWALDDAYHTLKNTGQYEFISIPAMTAAVEGEGTYIDGVNRDGAIFDDIKGWWYFTFPIHFEKNSIIKERADGKAAFWQMIMLDLATASTGKLRYYEYPQQDVKYDWYTIGGVDPTTFQEGDGQNKNSHFALCYLSKLPSGGAVIVGGILDQCTQLQAENYILAAQGNFTNWQYVAIEDISVGKVFLQTLQRNANIRAIPSGLKGVTDGKISSKRDRVLSIAKWFENGTIRISNADTPFLNAVRRLFEKFYDLDPKHDYSFDAGDAVFHAMRNMPEILTVQVNELPSEKKIFKHPLAGIGSYSGLRR